MARKDGDDYLISGQKMWITNSLQADWMCMLVNTGEGPVHKNKSLVIVDGLLASVGSTNFDPRSFHLNDEANLNVYDTGFAAQLTRIFEQDLVRCTPCTLAQWRARPLREKLRERVTSWLAPVL